MFALFIDLFFKYIPLFFLSKIKSSKQIWLFSERRSDARDNGYVIYKWLRENHPEINAIYAIEKKCADYDNVKDLGPVVEYGSLKHWWYVFSCSVICGTSWHLGIPNPRCYKLMKNIMPPKCKRVFLQHGITKDFMPQGLKQNLRADIFLCGAKPEWEYIDKTFGYTNGEVKYLGFPRYDNLIDKSSKTNGQILFMPTWRFNLKNESDFLSSDYFHTINSLLTSNDLKNFLIRNNTELIYFVHPAFKKYKKHFCGLATEKIKILSNDDDDMQKYICSANLLITDYSSIYFDFAYQKKPVLYYQFDYDNYRENHYSEGYFSYEKDGFGTIIHLEDKLIQELLVISSNKWMLSQEFSARAEKFFPIRDTNNCQRLFCALLQTENS